MKLVINLLKETDWAWVGETLAITLHDKEMERFLQGLMRPTYGRKCIPFMMQMESNAVIEDMSDDHEDDEYRVALDEYNEYVDRCNRMND